MGATVPLMRLPSGPQRLRLTAGGARIRRDRARTGAAVGAGERRWRERPAGSAGAGYSPCRPSVVPTVRTPTASCATPDAHPPTPAPGPWTSRRSAGSRRPTRQPAPRRTASRCGSTASAATWRSASRRILIVAKVPAVAGSIVLPPIFDCPDSTGRQVPLQSQLRFGPQGQLDGTIQGFLPSCPINLAAVQVTVTDASLTFSTAGGAQSIVLAASATASFTLASSPVTGSGSVAIDLLRGRLLSGSLAFQGPFQMSLPRQPAVLSFTLQSASLDSAGVHVDGRAQLGVPGGAAIGATFDQLTINPQNARDHRGPGAVRRAVRARGGTRGRRLARLGRHAGRGAAHRPDRRARGSAGQDRARCRTASPPAAAAPRTWSSAGATWTAS